MEPSHRRPSCFALSWLEKQEGQSSEELKAQPWEVRAGARTKQCEGLQRRLYLILAPLVSVEAQGIKRNGIEQTSLHQDGQNQPQSRVVNCKPV